MIETSFGKTKIEGFYPEIVADYVSITISLHKALVKEVKMGKEDAWKKINRLVEDAKSSADDTDEETVDDELDKMLSELPDLILKRMAGDSFEV